MNEDIVKGLRELADFLEARPELAKVDFVIGHGYLSAADNGRRRFAETVRTLGTCRKSFDDNHVNADVEFSGGVKLGFRIDREAVCKKIVTWDCGDASFLKEIGMDAEQVPQ
jgi:hypothetical protein